MTGPVTTVQQVTNGLNAKFAIPRNVLDQLSARSFGVNLCRNLSRDLGQMMAVLSASALAAFRDLVGAVVGWRSKPQVVGVHTGWRVASVKHVEHSRLALVDSVGEAMGKSAAHSPAFLKHAVSSRVGAVLPKPASCDGVELNGLHKSFEHSLTLSTQGVLVNEQA